MPTLDREKSYAPWEGMDLSPGVYRWGVVLLVLVGAALRVAHLARPFNRLMAWNEGHYAMIALNFDRYGLWSQYDDLGADHTFSPGVPWLIWGAFRLFGPTEWAARLPIALSGIAAIALVAALARRLLRSEQIALIAAAFVAVAPGLVYFSQNVQLDTPSICCALAGAVLMLQHRETQQWKGLFGAGVSLAVAIWFKFTAVLLYPAYFALWWPARQARPAVAVRSAAAFVIFTSLPSALWIVAGWFAPNISRQFYHRMWDLRGLGKALLEIPLEVETHLFIPIFLLLIAGIPVVWRWRSRLWEIWVWCVPWIIPYFLAPWDSLVTRYYDLPATYLLAAPAALALWAFRVGRARSVAGRALLAPLGIIIALTLAYDLWDPMTDRIARATMPHAPPVDPVPFYSARIVANLPRGRTVVDWPQTMFYAGGDPAWIAVRWDPRLYIDSEEFDYIILNDYEHGQEPYYAVDDALRERFARHHYLQIGPGAWAHERTAIADLAGHRDPATPYWSPAPAWRLHGMAIWE